jgi:MFS family permease
VAADPTPGGGSSYRRLFRNRNYFRVFSAGVASVAGSAIAGICIIWIVYAQTGSALDVGLLGTANLVGAILFSVFGGALVDRYDRRRLMILADLSRMLSVIAVVAVLLTHGFNLGVLLAAEFVLGAFTTVFNPAEQALVPALVGGPEIADANGLIRSSRSSIQFVGTSIAGVLIVTVGPLLGVAVNAVTFGVSAALLFGMRLAPLPGTSRAARHESSYFQDIRAGFAWLGRSKGFLQLTLSATFFNFCSSLIGTFLVFYATEVLHGSALVYALLLAVEVAGTGIGSLLVGRTGAVRWAGRAWTVPYGAVSGGVALVLALVPSVPVALVALFALGTLGGFAGTAWLTAAQVLVPTEVQGRYFGIDQLGSVAILPAAQIGGAFLILAVGIGHAYAITAVVWIVAGVVFLAPRALWNLGVRPGREATLRSDDGAVGTSGSPEETRSG